MTVRAAHVPVIRPVEAGKRPLISVVIPTYEPSDYLIETVQCVLSQDQGADQMQIAIIDDGSRRAHPETILKGTIPADRIEYFHHKVNVGLAANWNRAIDSARGHFVHILHQDDAVSAGFYSKLAAGLTSSTRVGMAFCRHAFVDGGNRIQRISHRERWRPGVLPRWVDRISERQRIQCPAAIVRREAYETLGGFRPDLSYALDWEMWARIACKYDVWYEPEVLAQYRRHSQAESARLHADGRIVEDLMSAIEAIRRHLPRADRNDLVQRAYARLIRTFLRREVSSLEAGHTSDARDHIRSARIALERLNHGTTRWWLGMRLRRLQSDRSAELAHEDR